jgi:hypothetical protein
MTVGTKSLLFGVHQFLLHPFFVALAWRKVYGSFPADPRIWFAFLVHDWGYWGCPEMDGKHGKWHPVGGAIIMRALFGVEWGRFVFCHSRSVAKLCGLSVSPLCAADKLAFAMYPRWLYLLLARASGEIREYMRNAATPSGRAVGLDASTPRTWFDSTRAYMVRAAEKCVRGDDPGVGPEDMERGQGRVS